MTGRRPLLLGVLGGVILVVAALVALAVRQSQPPQLAAEPTPTATAVPTPEPTPTERPTPSPTPTPSPSPVAERLTVLMIGTDSSAARRAVGDPVNTDAIHVASISADRSQIAVVSLPRDTVDIPMPDGSLWTTKVNSLYSQLGAEALRDALETLYGIEIDRYVAIDMDDFVGLVDAVGGIDVHLTADLYDPSGWGLAAGSHHLDGANALMFAQTRYGDNDYARSARHQQVLVALRDRLLTLDDSFDPAALLASLGSLDTDVTAGDAATFAQSVLASTGAQVSTMVLGPPRFALYEGIEGPARGWVMIPNVAEMRVYVQAVMTD